MNLLEADRLSELSQELNRYAVHPTVRTVMDTTPPTYCLWYHGVNEGYLVKYGVKHVTAWIINREDYSFATEDEAWEQLPDELKELRRQYELVRSG